MARYLPPPVLAILALAVFTGLTVGLLGHGLANRSVDAETEAATIQRATRAEPTGSSGLAPCEVALQALERALRSHPPSNERIGGWLQAVFLAYMHPPPPPGRPWRTWRSGTPDADGVSAPELAAYAKRRSWPDAYLDAVRAYRRRAEALFIDAVAIEHVDWRTGVNVCTPVNRAAAQDLAAIGNTALWSDLRSVVEKKVQRRYRQWDPAAFYDAVFDALLRLGASDALEWMAWTFTGSARSGDPHETATNAAHRAMAQYDRETVSGALRRRVVLEMLRTYAGVETMAGRPHSDTNLRAYWGRIQDDVIAVTRHFAFDPRGADGKAIQTMALLARWFGEHRDPARPPWTRD